MDQKPAQDEPITNLSGNWISASFGEIVLEQYGSTVIGTYTARGPQAEDKAPSRSDQWPDPSGERSGVEATPGSAAGRELEHLLQSPLASTPQSTGGTLSGTLVGNRFDFTWLRKDQGSSPLRWGWGFLRVVAGSQTLAGFWGYGARRPEQEPLLVERLPSSETAERSSGGELAWLEKIEIKSAGFRLTQERNYEQAISLLLRALEMYRADLDIARQNHTLLVGSHLISEAAILGDLVRCYYAQADSAGMSPQARQAIYEKILSTLEEAIDSYQSYLGHTFQEHIIRGQAKVKTTLKEALEWQEQFRGQISTLEAEYGEDPRIPRRLALVQNLEELSTLLSAALHTLETQEKYTFGKQQLLAAALTELLDYYENLRKQVADALEKMAALGTDWPEQEQDGLRKLHFLLGCLLPELVGENRFLIHAREQAEENLANTWQQAFRLSEWLETWRTRLEDDAERMHAQEEGQPFFQRLIRLFIGLDNEIQALVLSERARARAFIDLLAQQDTKYLSAAEAASANLRRAATTTLAGIAQIVERRHSVTLEYFVLQECLLIWIIQPTGEIAFCTSEITQTELTLLVETCLALMRMGHLSPRERKQRSEMLENLYACLIEPIPEHLWPVDPAEVVTIIPHGPLFRLPFGALKKAQGTHLIEKHALVYAPSLATLEYTSRHQARVVNGGKRALLAFVNPAPLPVPRTPTGRRTEKDSLIATPLPLIEEYFGLITAFYEQDEGNHIYAGKEATKWRVGREAGHYSTLCFATHAQAFETAPLESYLALAVTETDDGYLSVADVWQLTLQADLVILLACETGGGEVTGDGVNGLSRAFLGAGASSLFLSFWPVNEEGSLEQLRLFHDYWLNKGYTRAEALRRTQIDTLRNYPEQPDIWAAFALFGEG